MLSKLMQYESMVCSELAHLGRILDPRFPNDMVEDYEILQRQVVLEPVGVLAFQAAVERKKNRKSL